LPLDANVRDAELLDYPGVGFEVPRHRLAGESRWRGSKSERQEHLIGQMKVESSIAPQVLEQGRDRLFRDCFGGLPSRPEGIEAAADAIILGGQEDPNSWARCVYELGSYDDARRELCEHCLCSSGHALWNVRRKTCRNRASRN